MKHLQPDATEYEPTPAEARLIEVLLEPEHRLKKVVDICRIAECDKATYYRAFDKPGFVELYTRKSQELAKKYLGPVMNAFVREATRGSFQHGKVLLEMAGAYKETSRKEVAGDKDNPIHMKISRTSAMTDEELEQALAELEAEDDESLDILPEIADGDL